MQSYKTTTYLHLQQLDREEGRFLYCPLLLRHLLLTLMKAAVAAAVVVAAEEAPLFSHEIPCAVITNCDWKLRDYASTRALSQTAREAAPFLFYFMQKKRGLFSNFYSISEVK